MTDRDALLAAILSHPDEDTPRLALADYLDEHGDSAEQRYAAFIRKQIELANVPEYDPRWVRAWHDDRDSLTGRGSDSFRPEVPPGIGWPTRVTFRRGFPWHVETIEAAPFLGAVDQLVRAIPLQALTVKADTAHYRDPVQLPALLASPHLTRLRQLEFSLCRFTPDTARALRDCPHLNNLRSLVFELATLDTGAARELLKPPLVERLESLEFRSAIFSWSEAVAAINAVGGPHRLRRFHLTPFTSMALVYGNVFQARCSAAYASWKSSDVRWTKSTSARCASRRRSRNWSRWRWCTPRPACPGPKRWRSARL